MRLARYAGSSTTLPTKKRSGAIDWVEVVGAGDDAGLPWRFADGARSDLSAKDTVSVDLSDGEKLGIIAQKGATLDVSQWAHDAVALALPDKILCRPDCAGLCPVCGRNLNGSRAYFHALDLSKGPPPRMIPTDLVA